MSIMIIRGLDKIDSQGISASILKKKLKAKDVLLAAFLLYFVSLIIGIILAFCTSIYLLFVGAVYMLFGYIYTGVKYPIAYSPFWRNSCWFFYGNSNY